MVRESSKVDVFTFREIEQSQLGHLFQHRSEIVDGTACEVEFHNSSKELHHHRHHVRLLDR